MLRCAVAEEGADVVDVTLDGTLVYAEADGFFFFVDDFALAEADVEVEGAGVFSD